MHPLFSVIIPCRNEERYIGSCLDSVLSPANSPGEFEVFVVDGMSNDNTRNIVEKYVAGYPFVHLLDNPRLATPFALNLGIQASTGTFIVIISAHAWFPENYFHLLIDWHSRIEADCIGGVCVTEVKNKNPLSNSIKKVLSSRLGVGNAEFRLGTREAKEVDTVAFGCYRSDVLKKTGLFNELLIRNQDIELNKRLIKNGGKIFLVPDVSYVYYARETLCELAKNNFGNGKWNILTLYYSGDLSSISLRHLVPFFFIISLILPVILAPVWWPLALISAGILVFYLAVVFIASLRLNSKDVSVGNLIRSFISLHFSYGFGSQIGFCWLFGRLFKQKK